MIQLLLSVYSCHFINNSLSSCFFKVLICSCVTSTSKRKVRELNSRRRYPRPFSKRIPGTNAGRTFQKQRKREKSNLLGLLTPDGLANCSSTLLVRFHAGHHTVKMISSAECDTGSSYSNCPSKGMRSAHLYAVWRPERPARIELAPQVWKTHMQPLTPWSRLAGVEIESTFPGYGPGA